MTSIVYGSGLTEEERKELDSLCWIQQEDLSDVEYARVELLLAKRSKEDLALENKRDDDLQLRFETEAKFMIELRLFVKSCLKKYSPNGSLTTAQMIKWFKSEVEQIEYDLENPVVYEE